MRHPKLLSSRYALEKSGDAVNALALGYGNIKQRVPRAFALIHMIRPERDLPPELHADYEWVQNQMLQKGSVKATLHLMRRDTAAEIADRILHIYRELLKRRYQG
jgi:hypothetical protein